MKPNGNKALFSDFIRLIKGFVLVIGPKEAGKTSILRRLITGKFVESQPTLGFLEEYVAKVRLIEIGGHENYQINWKIALGQDPSHVFYVIDITNKTEYDNFLTFINTNNVKNFTLLANKFDLIQKIPKYLLDTKNIIVCSAKTGTAMMDILEEIIKYKSDNGNNIKYDKSTSLTPSDDEQKIVEKKIKNILEEFQGKF